MWMHSSAEKNTSRCADGRDHLEDAPRVLTLQRAKRWCSDRVSITLWPSPECIGRRIAETRQFTLLYLPIVVYVWRLKLNRIHSISVKHIILSQTSNVQHVIFHSAIASCATLSLQVWNHTPSGRSLFQLYTAGTAFPLMQRRETSSRTPNKTPKNFLLMSARPSRGIATTGLNAHKSHVRIR